MAKRTIKAKEQPTYMTLDEAYRKFENEKKSKGLVKATLDNYRKSIEMFREYFSIDDDTKIEYITRDVIIEWTNALKNKDISPAAVNHYIRDIRAFFYWCMGDDRKYLPRFQIDLVSAQEPPQKTFDKNEIDRLTRKPHSKTDIDFVEWRNWTIAVLVYDMGARAGSIVAMKLADVNLQKHTIYLRHTKNKKLAHLTLSAPCVRALREYINTYRADEKEDAPLFCNCVGEELTYNALAHSFKKYCKDRGCSKSSIHGLRHSFATQLAINTNGDYAKVQKALGHSSIDMARKYINLSNIDMGNFDDISPYAVSKKTKRGRPSKGVKKAKG